MRTLEDTDRKRLLNILIRHPFLESDRKRRALLINCGLEHLLSEIETAGSPRDFVHLLYAALTRNLTTKQSGDPWLVSLLTYLIDFSGPQDLTQEDREFLARLIQEWRQKFVERQAGPVHDIRNTDNPPSNEKSSLLSVQIKTAEAEELYLKYVVKSLEWLEITGLPIGVVAQSAPLDEVFIPLQLRPNRPLTEYPLTERELAEYYRRLKQNLPLRDLERYVFEAEKNWSTRERESISMNDFWQSLTRERPAAIIQGYPGVGKSTLLKYLALYMARRCLKQRSRVILAPLTPTLIPFLISLGDFANERTKNHDLSFMGYFQLKLSRLHIPGLSLFLEKRLEAGKCLILLDGLDEVSNHRMRIEIQNEIKEFILAYSDLFEESSLFNRFLVTTRVAGYDQAAFPAYPHYTIAELTPGQIDDFLPRWCRAIVRLDPAFARIAQNEPARFEREVQRRTEELQTSIHKRPVLQTLVENPLLQEPTLCIQDLSQQELDQHAPDWKKIVGELQSGSQPYLTGDGVLRDPAGVRELSYQKGFPFKDPAFPKRHIAAMASGSAVRSDNPFKEIQVPVRGALAIDMEGATFYRTVAEFAGLHSLLVKGVSDYADPDKDDSYHDYASAVSAIYVLSFIKDYLTTALMTRPGRQLSTSELGEIDQQPLRNDQESGQSKDLTSSRAISADSSSTDSIKLDKAQREQLHKALLGAFPSRLDLKRMVDFGLDQNLDNIVSNSNLDHTVFEVIKWAEAHGKVSELIRAAYQANSGNVQLRIFVSQIGFLGTIDS